MWRLISVAGILIHCCIKCVEVDICSITQESSSMCRHWFKPINRTPIHGSMCSSSSVAEMCIVQNTAIACTRSSDSNLPLSNEVAGRVCFQSCLCVSHSVQRGGVPCGHYPSFMHWTSPYRWHPPSDRDVQTCSTWTSLMGPPLPLAPALAPVQESLAPAPLCFSQTPRHSSFP